MMKWRIDGRPKRKWMIYTGISLLLIFVTALVMYAMWPQDTLSVPRPVPVEQPEQVSYTSVEGRYLLNGTVVLARAVEKYAYGDYAQPFSKLDTLQPEKYDTWTADFECPITTNTVPYQTQIDNLIFNCPPQFLPHAKQYFGIFDLANNHTGDQNGKEGLAETRRHLDEAGIQYFGTFNPADTEHACEVIALPVRIQLESGQEDDRELPVAFCGWHYFFRKPQPGEIAVMDAYAKMMPVFAFVEMGAEYYPKANDTQVAIAHEIVDHNPEFLIANNPHWVQNTEVYNDTLIVYSLGNFIFDQIDEETQRGASLDVALSVKYDDNVARWLELAADCRSYQDNCLAMAQKQGLKKVELQLQYGVVASTGGAGKLTQKADSQTQAAVEERMNWSQTCQALGYNACQ